MWTKEQLAYLAGFIDGEGTFYIQEVKRKNFLDYWPRFQIVNTNKEVMYWIHETFGGIIHSRDRSNESRNWRVQYQWYVTRNILDKILPLILPYLIIKKKHAEIMIEFRKTFLEKKTFRVTPDTITFRRECLNKIRQLNNP